MITGKIALGGLRLEFGHAEQRFHTLAQKVEALGTEHERLLSEEQEILDELSRHYLPDLSEQSSSTALSALRSKVEAARVRHDQLRRDRHHQLDQVEQLLSQADEALGAIEAEEEEVSRAVESVQAQMDQTLEASGTHPEATAELLDLRDRQEVLRNRRTRLGALAGVERRRYEGDRAFNYLRSRGFGEPSYRGGFLTRSLDRWLARSINFEQLDQHERILRHGPAEIQREIRGLEARTEELESRLETLERQAAEACDLRSVLERASEVQARLDDARESFGEVQQQRDDLAEQIRAMEADRGSVYEEVMAEHRAFLDGKEVGELLRLAASTPEIQDDALVSRLRDVRERVDNAARELHHVRRELARESRQASSLAEFSRGATTRFSSSRSLFQDGFRVEDVLKSLMDDQTTPSEALATLEAEHVQEPFVALRAHAPLGGWIQDLAASFLQPDALATHRTRVESEVIVEDSDGRIIHHRRSAHESDPEPSS